MSIDTEWTAIPNVAKAAQAGNYGFVLRVARTAAGMTLEEAAGLAAVSPSTLSRMETNPRRTWDVKELRRLAELFAIPAHLFGLSRSTADNDTASLGTDVDEGGDDMRRRDLIASTAAVVTGAITLTGMPAPAAAHGLVDTVEDVLFGNLTAAPIPGNQLAAQLAAARADFRATRYTQLARRLPRLLARATAGRDAASITEAPVAAARLAQAYAIATQLLIKLHDNGMAWSTADRAVQAARNADDPIILAEAQRLAATVMRRTHHRDGAQRLTLDTARRLHADTGLPDAASSALYGQILAASAYTAAMRDDRDTAWTLMVEAEAAARQVGASSGERFNMIEVAVYKISVARMLGDYGTAVEYARLVDPTKIASPERRARYWEDTALALNGRGKHQAAYQSLLNAERDTPQEIRYRPWAQELARELLTLEGRTGMAGIRSFANLIGAV
ncbi:transcriptional regulator with XRE-family HTH domain [Allocatelliglobosispora scoriae]|uniref:Transcriptional regulator with XRE-family HTH domain n=1 Tax=Allocatelliglobosispora scoriae TaxID=643052 RepID=A0A841BY57_9ACTN|nr:helix-turn-helix transcriptional regulator [Allocatelliglobosispora scoriae]MBB5871722.1 transcriptional regulator with XRE-family HTH domain [Allocatelliglobosispora scoriae]